MTKQEILAFINQNMACTLATCDVDQPHLRWMWLYRADEQGLIFHTGNMKDLYQQLQANPKVELCFYNGDPQNMIQVRVSGVAVAEEDKKLKDEIIAARPFLNPIIASFGYDSITVFRVKDLVATAWTMPTNLAPKEAISI